MKVSLITTVKNEEETIYEFLKSIADQTKQPEEILIVDGGSSDRTVEIIKSFKELPVKLLIENCNIAKGRNIGITNSAHNIIAVTDAGCILCEDWLEKITAFNNKIDVIVGNYKPIINGLFDACQYSVTALFKDEKSLKKFIISSRSLAFKKRVWEKLKGYPEWLNYSEDLYFHEKIKKGKYFIYFARNAYVLWNQRKNFIEIFKQYYFYMEGQAIAKLNTSKHLLRFTTYFIGLLFIILSFKSAIFMLFVFSGFIIYLGASIKNFLRLKKYKINFKAIFLITILLVWVDFAKMVGYLKGKIEEAAQ